MIMEMLLSLSRASERRSKWAHSEIGSQVLPHSGQKQIMRPGNEAFQLQDLPSISTTILSVESGLGTVVEWVTVDISACKLSPTSLKGSTLSSRLVVLLPQGVCSCHAAYASDRLCLPPKSRLKTGANYIKNQDLQNKEEKC